MAIVEKEPVRTFFGETFISVDESDATSADFQAPKKENRWCLMELPKDQIEALEAGQLFHIKAHSMGQSSNAALCTESSTWGLEFLENSNPMYLGGVAEAPAGPGKSEEPAVQEENKDPNSAVQGSEETKALPKSLKTCEIFAQCRGHLILKPLSSDTQRVRDLLAPHSIDEASESSSEPVTRSFLQFQVAASPKELGAILEQGPYVEQDGVWCWMPAAFEREVTDACLTLISLHNWSLASLDVKKLLAEVQQQLGERSVPSKEVLLNALRDIIHIPAAPAAAAEKQQAEAATATDAAPADGGAAVKKGKFALDPEKIKVFHATQLLREAPARLRERFDLPVPAARPKRPRLGAAAAAGGGGREPLLQIEELAAAFSNVTGQETTVDDLCQIVGDRMYVDEMEGSVHPLDVTTLPQAPRERLKRLFELSSHWKPDRLASLMTPTVKGVKIDAWIMKTTRTVYVEFEKGKEIRMITSKFAGMS